MTIKIFLQKWLDLAEPAMLVGPVPVTPSAQLPWVVPTLSELDSPRVMRASSSLKGTTELLILSGLWSFLHLTTGLWNQCGRIQSAARRVAWKLSRKHSGVSCYIREDGTRSMYTHTHMHMHI